MVNNFMTFNLKYDFIVDDKNGWKKRLNRICKVIKDNNPLCIGTQEGLINMLNDMGKELSNYKWIGEGREGADKGEFNAIFYKHRELDVIEWNQFWLSETPHLKNSISWDSACNRICTYVTFQEKIGGKKFTIYNTHLDYRSSLAREEGIKLICENIKKNYLINSIPFILMGDFNCFLDDKVFKIIKGFNDEKMKIINSYDNNYDIKGTFHNFKGGYEGGIIDFILFSKEIKNNTVFIDDRVIDEGYASDHYAVISELEI